MSGNNYEVLKISYFKNFYKWDVKQFLSTKVKSSYPVKELGSVIVEQLKKVKLSRDPEKEFGILGVSNEVGMFDAYTEKGKNINQPYKIVEDNFIAYNPYRVNVGSIGIKKSSLLNSFISSAYVVFSTKESLLPDYLFMLMQTDILNQLIRENTTGSVRQTLGFENLSKIEIPVPPKDVQEKLVANYNATMVQAKNAEEKASKYESEIEKYLFSELGISQKENNKERSSVLQTILFSELSYWDIKHSSDSITPQTLLKSSKYPNVNLLSQYQMNPRTTFPENLKQIAFLPMECISDIYGEVLTQQEIDSKTKGYTKFQNNDVIFAKITPCMQNGKCAVLKNLNTGYGLGSTEFHVFRTLSKNDSPDYLHNLLRTKLLRNTAMKYFTGSSGQQRVSSDFFKTLMIPLPPIEIQNEIVNHIDGIKEEIKKLREQAQNLRQKAKKDFEESVFDE